MSFRFYSMSMGTMTKTIEVHQAENKFDQTDGTFYLGALFLIGVTMFDTIQEPYMKWLC